MHEIEAVVFPQPGEVEMRRFQLPACGPDEIVVRTLYSLVSTGTELRVWAGHYGAESKFPFIPGYSIVGEIIEVGEEVRGWEAGRLVSGCNPLNIPGINSYWGAHASCHRYKVTGNDAPVVLPPGAEPRGYLIVEIGAISWRGVKHANVKKEESALVVGQGLIGALAARLLLLQGARTVVMDMQPSRLQRALSWGAAGAIDASQAEAEARVRELLPEGADIIIEAAGKPQTVKSALSFIRSRDIAGGGRIPRFVFQANYVEPVPADLTRLAPTRAITFLYPGDRGPEDRRELRDMVTRGQMKTEDFAGEPVSCKEALEAYKALRDEPASHFSLAFKWT